ncbi:MAG: S-methyl-5-thioribose-1-phosphate isomerase [Pirellulales bacterium]
MNVQTLRWEGDVFSGALVLIDQTELPEQLVERWCRDVASVVEAIRSLRVRGAPAIGIAAAYGTCLGVQAVCRRGDKEAFFAELEEAITELAASRPTAVNLFWALDRMRQTATSLPKRLAPGQIASTLLDQARAIHQEDRETCHAIGRHGAALLRDGQGVLTHCNAGALATAEFGTALGVLRAAHQSGKRLRIYADETRPLLQGARLTAWELSRDGLDVTVICDSAAAHVMGSGRVDVVIAGADRIAANGDVANKIGTYGLALLAAAHEVPFYIAAPLSTFDLSIACGDEIPIEERAAEEISHGFGKRTLPAGVPVYNPAFDVTPARLITAIICEAGVIRPVDAASIRRIVGDV